MLSVLVPRVEPATACRVPEGLCGDEQAEWLALPTAGALNVCNSITKKFYCDQPGQRAGVFVAGWGRVVAARTSVVRYFETGL